MVKLRETVMVDTDSEQASFDHDDSESERGGAGAGGEGEGGTSSSPNMDDEKGDKLFELVSAARGAAAGGAGGGGWGKVRGRMPQMRRRHGIHSSISVSANQLDADSIGRGSLSIPRGSMYDQDQQPTKSKLRGAVPTHMMGLSNT